MNKYEMVIEREVVETYRSAVYADSLEQARGMFKLAIETFQPEKVEPTDAEIKVHVYELKQMEMFDD